MIELVKNSYDADASFVSIRFIPPLRAGSGRIVITDDGHGMSLSDIQDKWMEPATIAKISDRRSRIKKRPVMGSKGIGRFAAAKLGQRMALNSVTQDAEQGSVEVLIPNLDWGIFSGDTYLSDVTIEYLTQKTINHPGTTIEISEFVESWSEAKLSRLYLELRRLISPLDDQSEDDFSIYFDLSGITREIDGFDGESITSSAISSSPKIFDIKAEPHKVVPFPVLSSSDYEVSGTFESDGSFSGEMQIKRAGQAARSIILNLPIMPDEEDCGRVGVRLFLFDREASLVRDNIRKAGLGDVTAVEARKILDSVAGIAIYRSGFRVRPYGDPENDWLTLDGRRVQDPSLRIGHNQIAGYVTVEEQGASGLVERSSREGFEQNAAFRRLKRLVTQLLAQSVEPRRQKFREDAGLSRRRETSFEEVRRISELEPLKHLMSDIPKSRRDDAQKLFARQAALLSEKLGDLEERQRLLEAQSSLGQIIGEILHEGAPSATFLAKTGKRLQSRYQFLFDNSKFTDETRAEFPGKISLIRENGEKLQRLFETLRPLSGAKRGPPEDFYGVDVAHDVLAIFTGHHIETRVTVDGQPRRLLGYKDDLNTALVNLIGNALHWLEQSATLSPRVDVKFRWNGNEAIIYVEDNGPGIPEEFIDRIFQVGFTLKNGGTGLGLNIAREALARSNATLGYHLDFTNGTRFEIRYPCVGV